MIYDLLGQKAQTRQLYFVNRLFKKKKKGKTLSIGEDMEKLEILNTIGGNAK